MGFIDTRCSSLRCLGRMAIRYLSLWGSDETATMCDPLLSLLLLAEGSWFSADFAFAPPDVADVTVLAFSAAPASGRGHIDKDEKIFQFYFY